ncbi:MAG: 4-(cytidine 5'-diphospho)-2-C-methyl-D-erythritol kinase [Bacillota bacterium]|jgi:4-diphosphocytidyl-2-C-methyl-D-erythritol kinase
MPVTEWAQAKINLHLHILGQRPDGYHQLRTVMHTLSLADQLVMAHRPHGIQLTCDDPRLSCGADNLAYRAARLLADRYPGQGVSIHLRKRIPWQAGLGGGSSDAAAVLRGLNRLWRLHLSLEQLSRLGAELGSDVPFFLYGGMALAVGRGELVEPLPHCLNSRVALVIPPFGLSTPAVYGAYRPSQRPVPRWDDLQRALIADDRSQIARLLHNDLEQAAFTIRPELNAVKQRLVEHDYPALLSGSGSSIFALLPETPREPALSQALPSDYRLLITRLAPRLPGISAGDRSLNTEL